MVIAVPTAATGGGGGVQERVGARVLFWLKFQSPKKNTWHRRTTKEHKVKLLQPKGKQTTVARETTQENTNKCTPMTETTIERMGTVVGKKKSLMVNRRATQTAMAPTMG